MGTYKISRSFGLRFTVVVVALLSIAAAQKAAPLPGTASLTGTVDSSKPFKAARVYIRNTDKRILYMVFTNAGDVSSGGAFSRQL